MQKRNMYDMLIASMIQSYDLGMLPQGPAGATAGWPDPPGRGCKKSYEPRLRYTLYLEKKVSDCQILCFGRAWTALHCVNLSNEGCRINVSR
jgi:hypothetical protein